MKRWNQRLTVLIAVMLCLALRPASSDAAETAGFYSERDGPAVTFALRNANDLYAYDLVFTYDDNRLEWVGAEIDHGGFRVQPIVEKGSIRIAYTLVGPKPGLTGDIALVKLSFKRRGEGPASIVWEKARLVDSALQSVEYRPGILEVLLEDGGFTDMRSHWAEQAVTEAARLGLVQGYEDGSFRPERKVTRGEAAVLLARALKLPESRGEAGFADEQDIPAWARNGVTAAAALGLVHGYEDGSFRAGQPITRAELAVMLAHSAGGTATAEGANDAATRFADAGDIPLWALEKVEAAVEMGLMKGRSESRFAPQEYATRAEMVQVLLRLLQHQTS